MPAPYINLVQNGSSSHQRLSASSQNSTPHFYKSWTNPHHQSQSHSCAGSSTLHNADSSTPAHQPNPATSRQPYSSPPRHPRSDSPARHSDPAPSRRQHSSPFRWSESSSPAPHNGPAPSRYVHLASPLHMLFFKPTLPSHIWRTPPESNTTHTVKKAKVALPTGTQGRVTVRDFDENIGRSILKGALGHFESRLCMEWPYPDEDREMHWAWHVWTRSSQDWGANANAMLQALKLVVLMPFLPICPL
jgi:hypothetical protein